MFAGAAREAVFSDSTVIQRVRTQFVPVALKAGLVNNPPPGLEGRFLREISRSKPAPQGICVASGSGKVLAWALSFDDGPAVTRFLDHVLARYKSVADASEPVAAQRYMRFPTSQLPDVADTQERLPDPMPHGTDKYCPATPPKARGTVVAKVWGRAVSADGELSAACNRQENYSEDVFDIPPILQAELAGVVASANGQPIRIPDALARLFCTYAYLGQLDVRPLNSPVPGTRTDVGALEFSATLLESRPDGVKRLRVTGRSDVRSRNAGTPSRGFTNAHDIRLTWEGDLTLQDEQLTGVALYAEGRERLQWGTPAMRWTGEKAVAHLPAGRYLDLETDVRYGILGTPVPDEDAWRGDVPAPPQPGVGGPPIELQQKIQRLQQRMQRLAQAGRSPAHLQRGLQQAIQMLQTGRQADAESRLDQLLRRSDEPSEDAPAAPGLRPGAGDALRAKIEEFHREVQRVVAEQRPEAVIRVLDQAIRELREDAPTPDPPQ